MTKEGMTPSETKGFRVAVGNPYSDRMTFIAVPMESDFSTMAADAVAKPPRLRLAPGQTRSVIVAFKIDSTRKERTIALCIMPEGLEGPILPRVCGLYTGHILGNGG